MAVLVIKSIAIWGGPATRVSPLPCWCAGACGGRGCIFAGCIRLVRGRVGLEGRLLAAVRAKVGLVEPEPIKTVRGWARRYYNLRCSSVVSVTLPPSRTHGLWALVEFTLLALTAPRSSTHCYDLLVFVRDCNANLIWISWCVNIYFLLVCCSIKRKDTIYSQNLNNEIPKNCYI